MVKFSTQQSIDGERLYSHISSGLLLSLSTLKRREGLGRLHKGSRLVAKEDGVFQCCKDLVSAMYCE